MVLIATHPIQRTTLFIYLGDVINHTTFKTPFKQHNPKALIFEKILNTLWRKRIITLMVYFRDENAFLQQTRFLEILIPFSLESNIQPIIKIIQSLDLLPKYFKSYCLQSIIKMFDWRDIKLVISDSPIYPTTQIVEVIGPLQYLRCWTPLHVQHHWSFLLPVTLLDMLPPKQHLTIIHYFTEHSPSLTRLNTQYS